MLKARIERGCRLVITNLFLFKLLLGYGYSIRGYYAIGGEFLVIPMLLCFKYLKDSLKEFKEVINND